MKDSVVYQEIFEEGFKIGQIRGARSFVTRVGAKTLGAPDALAQAQLEEINDLVRLEALADAVVDCSFATWAELLASVR